MPLFGGWFMKLTAQRQNINQTVSEEEYKKQNSGFCVQLSKEIEQGEMFAIFIINSISEKCIIFQLKFWNCFHANIVFELDRENPKPWQNFISI